MFDDVWTFLRDPANRDVLAWIGGGIVAIAAGLWAVIRFFAAKPAATKPTVAADNKSVAVGGNVSNSPINVGDRTSAKR